MNKEFSIIGPKIHLEDGTVSNQALTVAGGKIAAIGSDTADTILEYPGNYHVIPGMIDLHIHGAMGADVMDATPEALETISTALAKEGVTRFLATTMTEKQELIVAALENIAQYSRQVTGAKIAGIHLEGPFLSPEKTGAQDGEFLLAPDIELLGQWQASSGNNIRLVTLAVELPQADSFIRYCKENGITVSVGHTNATYEQAKHSFDLGVSHCTHLYNAMSGFTHRNPGVVPAVLDDQRVSAELIVDGIHVDPAIVNLTLKIKGPEQLMLVTDAMRAKCLGDGQYDLGGQQVTVTEGRAMGANGYLAGSTLTMQQAFVNLLSFTGANIAEAIRMSSENPAKTLHVFGKTGSIASGKLADLVILDQDYQVVSTLCEGESVYDQAGINK